MKAPEFLKVLPADIGRVGGLGACILAAIRYMTGLPGEANGRRVVEGETWWRASHDDIAHALGGAGVPRRTVSWTVKKLVETGDVAAIPTQDFYGDRAQAYRVLDQPLARSDQGSEQPLADIADRSADIAKPVGKIRPSTSADIANLPSVGELAEPSGGKNARKRAARLPDGWEPSRETVEKMHARYPDVDLRAEHEKFTNHHRGKGSRMVDWNAAWRNWIIRADEWQTKPAPRSTSDERVAQAQALKHRPARLEIL